MHAPFLKSILGFIGAGFACFAQHLSFIFPSEVKGIFEGGAWTALVCLLIYAVRSLKDDLEKERTRRETDQNRWENKWASEHEANIDAREKDRIIREKLADAVKALADAIPTKKTP